MKARARVVEELRQAYEGNSGGKNKGEGRELTAEEAAQIFAKKQGG